MSDTITINRAPVLTLWAAVVAERLGLNRAPPSCAARHGWQQCLPQRRVTWHYGAQGVQRHAASAASAASSKRASSHGLTPRNPAATERAHST